MKHQPLYILPYSVRFPFMQSRKELMNVIYCYNYWTRGWTINYLVFHPFFATIYLLRAVFFQRRRLQTKHFAINLTLLILGDGHRLAVFKGDEAGRTFRLWAGILLVTGCRKPSGSGGFYFGTIGRCADRGGIDSPPEIRREMCGNYIYRGTRPNGSPSKTQDVMMWPAISVDPSSSGFRFRDFRPRP